MYWRWCEYLILFWLFPISLFIYREHLGYVLMPLVITVAGTCSYLLFKKGVLQHQWRQIKSTQLKHIKAIGQLFVLLAIPVAILIGILIPEKLFDLPINATQTWILVLLLYPVISVIPQELIFRSYFFHRYRKLFKSDYSRWFLSSFSFGLAHLLYANWIAVVMSFFGGLLFGYRFIASKNIAVVVIEHSLWGTFIFTSGLGSYFIVSQWL